MCLEWVRRFGRPDGGLLARGTAHSGVLVLEPGAHDPGERGAVLAEQRATSHARRATDDGHSPARLPDRSLAAGLRREGGREKGGEDRNGVDLCGRKMSVTFIFFTKRFATLPRV